MLLCTAGGCTVPDPGPSDAQPSLTVVGIYEGSSAAADNSTEADTESRSGASVDVYSLADNGTQTPVAGGAQQAVTDSRGGFEIKLFEKVKNLVIKISKNGDETKCVIPNVSQQEHQAGDEGSMPGRSFRAKSSAAPDNATEYALVNIETDVAADIILSEVEREGTPPGAINTQDVDEIIDPFIAQDIKNSPEIRDCVIGLLQQNRSNAQALFIEILEDQTLNQQSVDNATGIIREALISIEAVRKDTRKEIYELKIAGGDIDDQVQALESRQRRQIMEILKAAGIPPQLYMKASLVAQCYFRAAVFRIGPSCNAQDISLGIKLIRRAFIRKIRMSDSHRGVSCSDAMKCNYNMARWHVITNITTRRYDLSLACSGNCNLCLRWISTLIGGYFPPGLKDIHDVTP